MYDAIAALREADLNITALIALVDRERQGRFRIEQEKPSARTFIAFRVSAVTATGLHWLQGTESAQLVGPCERLWSEQTKVKGCFDGMTSMTQEPPQLPRA